MTMTVGMAFMTIHLSENRKQELLVGLSPAPP